MKLNFSLDTAVIVTLISVLLYMVGQVYLNAFLRPFGAEALVLNFSIQDKLYYGYLKTVTHWIILALAAIIIFIAIPLFYKGFGLDSKVKIFFKNLNKKIKKKGFIPPIHNSSQEVLLEQSFNSKIYFLYSLMIFLIFSLLYLSHTEKVTEKQANNYLNNYSTQLSKINLIKPELNTKVYKIICGQSLCAVLLEKDKKINLRYIDPKEIEIPNKNLKFTM